MPSRTLTTSFRWAPSLLVAGTLAFTTAARGEEQLQIRDVWSRATPPTAGVGAAYFEIGVASDGVGDRLIGVTSPVAERATLHTTVMDGDVMKMRPLEALEITPTKPVSFKPGSHHVMLMGLKGPLTEGQRYPLTLKFEKTGDVTVEVTVRGLSGIAPPDHDGHDTAQHVQQTSTMAASRGKEHAHTKHHGTQHSGHKHGGAMHKPVNIEDPARAPQLEVIAHEDATDGWNLQLVTRNFSFAPERVNQAGSSRKGGEHTHFEGHAHLYVDGKKLRRIYGEWIHLPALDPGKHELRVTLNANDHGHYALRGKPIEFVTEIEQK